MFENKRLYFREGMRKYPMKGHFYKQTAGKNKNVKDKENILTPQWDSVPTSTSHYGSLSSLAP